MAGIIERMKKLIQDIECENFKCKKGFPLETFIPWEELKREVNRLEAGAMTACVDATEPCLDARPKNRIERMKEELQELEVKLDKLVAFLEKETKEPKFTDDYQRQLLAAQKSQMIGYYNILLLRIENDKKKIEKSVDAPCSTSENYDQVVENYTRSKEE